MQVKAKNFFLNHRRYFGLLLLAFTLACSPLEVVRLFGIGTRPFKTKGKVYSKVADQDFFSTYNTVVAAFGELKANYYRGSRRDGFIIFTNLNVSFPQANSSTEVAVFLGESGPKQTRIEVSSLNHSLAEFTAKKLFERLDKEKTNE